MIVRVVVICISAAVICYAAGFYGGLLFASRMSSRCGQCINCHTADKHMPCEARQ